MRIHEIQTQKSKIDKVKKFADWAITRLKIRGTPRIEYGNDQSKVNADRTFGSTRSDGIIWVHVGNRNPADIMRTLVHELIHFVQFEQGTATDDMDDEQRLAIEDEANAMAGRLMREYGQQHGDIYEGKLSESRTGSLQHEVSDSLPQAYVIPVLNSSNAYEQYKFGVAIASARGKKSRENDKIAPFNKENSKVDRDWADNEVIISYDPHIDEIIDSALKAIGKDGPNSKRVIGVKGSKESKDVPKGSPVKPFKGY